MKELRQIKSAIGMTTASVAAIMVTIVLSGPAHAEYNFPMLQKTDGKAFDGSTFVLGDQLSIKIYERISPTNRKGGTRKLLSSMIEHTEFSGNYTVQMDGTISIPFFGDISVAGLGREQLKKRLLKMSAKAFSGAVTVVIRITKRDPIYVTGRVPRSGTFTYQPGMMVLNAAILAGMPEAGTQNWRKLDLARMTEYLRRTDAKLAEHLAKRDVLIAQRKNAKPVASRALVVLVGAVRAQAHIKAFARVQDLEEKRRRNKLKSLHMAQNLLVKERKILLANLRDATAIIKHKKDRFSRLRQLRHKRVVSDTYYFNALGELDAAKAHWNTLSASIARLERRIVDHNAQASEAILERTIKREREIAKLESYITAATVTRATLSPALSIDSRKLNAGKQTYQFVIVRRTTKGIFRTTASRFTLLRPGDILEIVRGGQLPDKSQHATN